MSYELSTNFKGVEYMREYAGLYFCGFNGHWGGTLDLSNTPITQIPDNIKVSGPLFLSYTQIIHLPDNLVVGGSLDLENTKITHLPDNLVVGGDLDLRYSEIKKKGFKKPKGVKGDSNVCV